eukprot:321331-Pyramimonas_sp.AAC.1
MLTNDSADGTPPVSGPDGSTLPERCPTASPQAQEGSTSVGDRWRGLHRLVLQLICGSRPSPLVVSMLRVATQPVSERRACFLDDNDLGQLGAASTSSYKVVSTR